MEWKRGPPVLVGEKVLWSGNGYNQPETGVIKWIGIIPEISPDWCVGIELYEALPSLGGDGFWKERKLFECRSKHGLLVPIQEIQKRSSKVCPGPISSENYSHFKLDDTQLRDFTHSDLRRLQSTKENRKSATKALDGIKISRRSSQLTNQDVTKSPERSINIGESEPQKKANTLDSFIKSEINKTLEYSAAFDSKVNINELINNMNEVAGYFKEIKEGDERFEEQEPTNLVLHDPTEASHSKPKKLFSFLKWFNKKHKQEPNLNLFKDSSAASSPMFPRKETSSCESIDTLFSTQTVRSFAYIPPTQYRPSAPPLDYNRSSQENVWDNFSSEKNGVEESESIYEKRKKRKAPEPPRLSRENSLPTTLERKNDEEFNEVTTFHRRTVSESFKDKKAGSYCHVQGKRKAPPPPAAPLYPNLQKINSNQYPSLYKKKKPAPPPPDFNTENLAKIDVLKEKETSQPIDEPKKEKAKDLKDNGSEEKEEKGMKINQTPKDRFTKDTSLSPLPSRPWYKRSHRDSTGSNIIRKDLLKGFERKKNKETDDWMPEVGFPRRSLSTESHGKFNIFSKLEKTEEKKKEEKRKSQISILTNISELDREAAEIVRKEQAEEKKMLAANDAKYYSTKEIKGNNQLPDEMSANMTKTGSFFQDNPEKNKTRSEKTDGKTTTRMTDRPVRQKTENEPNTFMAIANPKDEKTEQTTKEENLKPKDEILKNKENNLKPNNQSNDNQRNSFSSNVLADLTNASQSPAEKFAKPSQNSAQARLNFFSVQNKELNYLNEPWVCEKCTLENPGWRVFCEICSSIKSRFPLYKEKTSTAPAADKAAIKTEDASAKPKKSNELKPTSLELKPVSSEIKEETKPESQTLEKEIPVETLDELRKKRTNFFSSKLGSPELEKNEAEPFPNDSKTKLKKIAKELRQSFTEENVNREEKNAKLKENIEEEERKNKEEYSKIQLKRKQEDEKNRRSIKEQSLKEIEEQKNKGDAVKDQNPIKFVSEESPIERREKDNKSKENTETRLVSNEQIKNTENEKVIEAYVITKTIVLEDVIVKKPDRGKKVSASVQTKSSLPVNSERVVRPPRTKKISFESTSQIDQGTEPELDSENEPQRVPKNEGDKELEELTTKLTQAEGLADFRAKIETMPPNTEMNTVAVNRLLRKLEAAINCGDHYVAAGLAKELAMMKINCSVTRQITPSAGTSKITTDLYIEDKLSHQGPIPLEVSPTMNLLQLKKKIHQEFGIPLEVQRWILGKKLATDDNKTLESEGVKTDYCPLFLYLVAPVNKEPDKETPTEIEHNVKAKPRESQQPTRENPETKGWYYNYEEDHYSYCEDSDDDLKTSSPDLDGKTKDIAQKVQNKVLETDLKKTEVRDFKKLEKSVFDLNSKDTENDAGKELKFVSVNFVKQKVEKLNKTLSENVKPTQRSSRSPENWKCGACNVVNLPGNLNCSSCNGKKSVIGPKICDEKKKELLKMNVTNENMHYRTLMELQDTDLVPNSEPFNCSICLVDYNVGEGVTLKDCLHTFCRTCLVGTVQFSEEAEVKCPYFDNTYSCQSVLQQREIKALVPKGIFELHLAKSVKEAENKIENAFHCKTPDCKGWCIYEDNVNQFRCPVCKFTNCLTCQAVHNGINCKEYQQRMKDASETDVDAKKTRDMLNEMVEKGEAMACPKCQVVLMKKWGCDWLKCSMCKTEICWVTRGFRWGPEGKGDTSGGCKCGVNGVKCHPKCNYCH